MSAAIPVAPATPATAPLASSAVFDAAMETKVAALAVRDDRFAREALTFLKPEHFSNVVERNLVQITQEHVAKYKSLPTPATLYKIVRTDSRISSNEHQIYGNKILELMAVDMKEREFIRSNVVDFCRHQAMLVAAALIPDLLKKKEFGKAKHLMDQAYQIGQSNHVQMIDYFAEAEKRKQLREDIATGKVVMGVPTGIDEIDNVLYRKGWGRGELTLIMAPSKRGKTAFLLQTSALTAVRYGTNVLFVSLEVDETIIGDRLDACLTGTEMMNLLDQRDVVEAKVKALASSVQGKIWIERRPANSFTTEQLEALIETYLNAGHRIDMVVVDYIGIMKMPSSTDKRHEQLAIAGKELRRIGGVFNVAMLSGAQTNRDAIGKQLSGPEVMGESYALVQDCDLLASINANDQEMAAGVRRIYWAASRNNPEVTIKVHGDLAKMQMIQRVIEITH